MSVGPVLGGAQFASVFYCRHARCFSEQLYVGNARGGQPAVHRTNKADRNCRSANGNVRPDAGKGVAVGLRSVCVEGGDRVDNKGRYGAGHKNILGGHDGAPCRNRVNPVDRQCRYHPGIRVTGWRRIDRFRSAEMGWNFGLTLLAGPENLCPTEMHRRIAATGVRATATSPPPADSTNCTSLISWPDDIMTNGLHDGTHPIDLSAADDLLFVLEFSVS